MFTVGVVSEPHSIKYYPLPLCITDRSEAEKYKRSFGDHLQAFLDIFEVPGDARFYVEDLGPSADDFIPRYFSTKDEGNKWIECNVTGTAVYICQKLVIVDSADKILHLDFNLTLIMIQKRLSIKVV